MEEFQSEEEEPWYDQQDLEQGKDGGTPQAARDGGPGGCGGQKKGQILGTGGWDTFSQDSRFLGKASALSCGGTSMEILALLLQTSVLTMESLNPMDRGREPRWVLSTRGVKNLVHYIQREAGSPENLLQADSNMGSYDIAFILEQLQVELAGTLVNNTLFLMY